MPRRKRKSNSADPAPKRQKIEGETSWRLQLALKRRHQLRRKLWLLSLYDKKETDAPIEEKVKIVSEIHTNMGVPSVKVRRQDNEKEYRLFLFSELQPNFLTYQTQLSPKCDCKTLTLQFWEDTEDSSVLLLCEIK